MREELGGSNRRKSGTMESWNDGLMGCWSSRLAKRHNKPVAEKKVSPPERSQAESVTSRRMVPLRLATLRGPLAQGNFFINDEQHSHHG